MWRVSGPGAGGVSVESKAIRQRCLEVMSLQLWCQAQEGELTDIRIHLDDGTKLHAHRGILSSRSKVFKGMFLSNMEEARTGDVKIGEVSASTFKSFLQFIYTGQTCDVEGDGSELWRLADLYEVDALKDYLLTELNESNVVGAIKFAAAISCDEIIASCAEICSKCLPRIKGESLEGVTVAEAKLLSSMYTGGLQSFLFAERWKKANPDEPGVEMLLDGIDLTLVSTEDLLSTIKPTGLLSTARLNSLYERRLRGQEWATQNFSHVRTIGSGEPTNDVGAFHRPVGVALMQGTRDAIVVADQENCRIQIWNLGDSNVRRFGCRGDGFGRFLNPVAVAVGPEERIYVCDHDRHEVQVFDSEGAWIASFGKEGAQRGEFVNPRDVAVSKDGNVVVCDKGNNRIQVLKEDGTPVFSFGMEGSFERQFSDPCSVACGPEGRIVVADSGNCRVQVFDRDGGFILSFGERGNGPGQFMSPDGIAVGAEGDILVSDWALHRVSIFRQDGTFVQMFGKHGRAGEGLLAGPAGVAVSSNGSVVIADQLNNKVQIWGRL